MNVIASPLFPSRPSITAVLLPYATLLMRFVPRLFLGLVLAILSSSSTCA